MISAAIYKVRERIARACTRVKRDPAGVTLVAATKGRSWAEISQTLDAGVRDIGENRVQEAAEKFRHLSQPPFCDRRPATGDRRPVITHMLGHLQSNKVKEAVRLCDMIQSVDSLRLAEEIDRRARDIGKTQDILLEIKTSPEATKYGIAPREAAAVLNGALQLRNIRVRGFMTIAPVVADPEKTRPYFRLLRELSDQLDIRPPTGDCRPVTILSMGMTDDFEIAVEEGSTMVRLGRAIFGE